MKVGDIKVNQICDGDTGVATGFQPGADSIQFFTPEGEVKVALSYATYEYLYYLYMEETYVPGWYEASKVADGSFGDLKDNESVAFGNGFVVKAGNGKGVLPTITSSGEVKTTPTEIPGQAFCFGGNSSPVEITVGQISCNQVCDGDTGVATGFQPGADSIQFFTAEGNVDKSLSYASYEYLYYLYMEEAFVPGWYEASKVADGSFGTCYDSRTIPAGTAFVYKTGTGKGVWPTITIPDPLSK